jgi:hypothetical protein
MFSVWSVRRLYKSSNNTETTEQLQSRAVRTEKSASLVRASMKLEEEWIIAAEEYKRSAGEELTQCDYIKMESVISNCKFRLTIYPINRA